MCKCGKGLFCECSDLDKHYDYVLFGFYLCANQMEGYYTDEGKTRIEKLKQEQDRIAKKYKL